MSILKTVTVYQCDECQKVTTVKSNEEFKQFEAEWHSSINYDFCPPCQMKDTTQARIIEDNNNLAAIDGKFAEIENPLKKILPDSKCERCFDSGVWLTPRNKVEICPNLQLGLNHQSPNIASFLFSRAAHQLNEISVWVSPFCFELARILTQYSAENPCPHTALIDCFYADTNLTQDEKQRKLEGLFAELKEVWILPIGCRENEPKGYWIDVNQKEKT
ncbi:MAG: hypothetical protein K1X72_04415 [Pyrinomonadaceae bacterium]|nr:hypothetical protein [Pyrinomonadaceae bacterium]